VTGFFGGAPALSWSKDKPGGGWEDNETLRGVPLGGRVIAIGEPSQQTKIGTGELMWWKEPSATTPGQPKMQMPVTLRCNGECSIERIRHLVRDLRNTSNPTDTGDRILYVPDYGDLNNAIKAAFVLAGDNDLKVGAELFVAWLGYRESKMKGAHPARTFAAQYVLRPSGLAEPVSGTDNLGVQQNPFGQQGTAQQQPQQPAAPSQQQQAQQAPPQNDNPFGGPSQVQQQQPAAAVTGGGNPFA
jgi:hypothetical protein